MTFKVRSSMGCAAVIGVLLAAGELRGFECLDDFEDGSITDGNPCSWADQNSCLGGAKWVEDGKLILEASALSGTWLDHMIDGDVGIRFQATAAVEGLVVAFINGDVQNCSDSRSGYIYYPTGEIGIGYTSNGIGTLLVKGVLSPPPTLEEVVILQLESRGGDLQLRVWRPGEEIPIQPLLQASRESFPTKTLQSGVAGIYAQMPESGQVIFDYIWVWSGPTAAMRVDPESGMAPLEVTVDGSASTTEEGHSIVSYKWDFGDGTVVEGVQATHTYAEAGLFKLGLTVTDDRGLSGFATREVLVSCPPGDPSPWQAADIGEPKIAGAFQKDGDCLRVCAGGTGILFALDQLSFASQEFQGDFVFTVEVTELETQVNGAGVGLMARESLDPEAKMAAICFEKLQNSFVPRFRVRSAAATSGTALGLPVRLRLERSGDEFIGSVSPDGTTWTEVGRKTMDLPEKALVGIAAFGKDSGNTSFEALQAEVCKVSPIPGGLPFRRGDSNADGATDISDAVANLNYLFLGDKNVPCEQAGDANDDGAIDISDAVYVLSFLFTGGSAIEPPVGECGVDPTGHTLPCTEFPGCE